MSASFPESPDWWSRIGANRDWATPQGPSPCWVCETCRVGLVALRRASPPDPCFIFHAPPRSRANQSPRLNPPVTAARIKPATRVPNSVEPGVIDDPPLADCSRRLPPHTAAIPADVRCRRSHGNRRRVPVASGGLSAELALDSRGSPGGCPFICRPQAESVTREMLPVMTKSPSRGLFHLASSRSLR